MKIPKAELNQIRQRLGLKKTGVTHHTHKGFKWQYPDKAMVVATVNRVLDELNVRVTVRQVYYQLVARNIIQNNVRTYKATVKLLTRAREAEIILWNRFIDRSRTFISAKVDGIELDPAHTAMDVFRRRVLMEFRHDIAGHYEIPRWSGQPHYVEVWTEKDALIGFIAEVCRPWQVPVLSCKGQVSMTRREEGRERFLEADRSVILYFGDHDPSGIQIPESIQDKLEGDVELKRMGLNLDDVKRYNLLPNLIDPEKGKDKPGVKKYVAHYGNQSWELDALPPQVLQQRVRQAIEQHFDPKVAKRVLTQQNRWRNQYTKVQEEMRAIFERSQLYRKLNPK